MIWVTFVVWIVSVSKVMVVMVSVVTIVDDEVVNEDEPVLSLEEVVPLDPVLPLLALVVELVTELVPLRPSDPALSPDAPPVELLSVPLEELLDEFVADELVATPVAAASEDPEPPAEVDDHASEVEL